MRENNLSLTALVPSLEQLLLQERELLNRALLAKDGELKHLAGVKVDLHLQLTNLVKQLELLEAEESRPHIAPSETVELTELGRIVSLDVWNCYVCSAPPI
ncbi:hypothetical protein IscW_ISCW001904 [Ixodes scapularis]|uniref:Uncharacterized protein n=1 Tax=Ixodes scapularis TaxID=6945 RepID=B7P9M7_IXOSC|nr:hypothetical protein IscW_ISCW001904 [Ixodes scapularis]|eukprot:XP_002404832.1 hypothetical protein IscW_ISCW001904 [Ixodes scapularis]